MIKNKKMKMKHFQSLFFSKAKNKKSQMEIMGLAIVVVLIALGMLFAVKFVLLKEDTGYRKEYTTTQLTANMLNTLLYTNTNCSGISVSELLEDASKYTHSIRCNDPVDSQKFVNKTINYLLFKTLNQTLHKDYYFKASTQDKELVEAGKSFSRRVRERKTHFLPTDVGTITIILDIYG